MRFVQGGLVLGSAVAAVGGMMDLAVGGVAFALPGITFVSAIYDSVQPASELFKDEVVSLQSDWRHYYGSVPAA